MAALLPSPPPRRRRPSAVAIGNFDGLHLGHRRILESLTETARRAGLRPLVLTFSPHPEKALGRGSLRMIQTLDRRVAGLRAAGVSGVKAIPFTRPFAEVPPGRFVETILVRRFNAKAVVVGSGFRFGKGRAGTVAALRALGRRLGFRVRAVPPVRRDGGLVSSSRIRALLEAGRVAAANRLMGRAYEIEGRVVRGRARGRALGFPTANIRTANEILPPGIFIARLRAGQRVLPALAYIGGRPTFAERGTSVEVHCLDFKKNIYGRRVQVEFLERIRPDRAFPSAAALVRRMEKDAAAARAYFRRSP
jgi:riboflavin kinase/FMN adenylyltransferase